LNYLRHPGEPYMLTRYKAMAYPDEYPEIVTRTPAKIGLEYEKKWLQLEQAGRRCHICKLPIPARGSYTTQGEFLSHNRCYEAGKPMPIESPRI
jgi:hypothetical protein